MVVKHLVFQKTHTLAGLENSFNFFKLAPFLVIKKIFETQQMDL